MKPVSWIRTTFLKCFVYYPQICDVKRSDAQHTGQTVQRKQKTHSSSSCQHKLTQTGLEKRQMQYLKNGESKGVSEVL